MAEATIDKDSEKELQLSCFYLGDSLYGYEIDLVQEVNDDLNITEVPLSQDFVVGIMNLRGQIITVIDQQKKVGLPATSITRQSRVIIIKNRSEHIGLLVDRIAEVVQCKQKDISKPPSNVNGIQGKLFKGVVQTPQNELLALLDIDAVLEDEL